jgi:hypothetical protein
MGMAESFGTVVIILALLSALIACASFVGSGGIYRRLGRGDLSLDEPDRSRDPQPGSSAWHAEAEAELRQLLDAKSARSEARGDGPIDVEAELARLTPQMSGADPELRAEVRDMVIASNERRARRGQPQLDVEAEVQRRLSEHGA